MPYIIIPKGHSLTAKGVRHLADVPIAEFDHKVEAYDHMKDVEKETGEMPVCFCVEQIDEISMSIMTLEEIMTYTGKH